MPVDPQRLAQDATIERVAKAMYELSPVRYRRIVGAQVGAEDNLVTLPWEDVAEADRAKHLANARAALAAHRDALAAAEARVKELERRVGFSTDREHRNGCPAIMAWDIPDACKCDYRTVTRCNTCGKRQRKEAS